LKKIELKINSCPVNLDISINSKLIEGCKLKKISFFSNLLYKKVLRGAEYWTKNCTIDCFREKFILIPSSDRKLHPIEMWGTSAYFYPLNNILKAITFQCIGNIYVAQSTAIEFENLCKKYYGNPELWGLFCAWKLKNSMLLTQLSANGKNFYVHWITIDYIRYIKFQNMNKMPKKESDSTSYCPRCKAQYREGFSKCSDCGVQLEKFKGDINYK